MTVYAQVSRERSSVEAIEIARELGIDVPEMDYDSSRGAYYIEDKLGPYEAVVYTTPDSILLRDDTIFDTVTDSQQPALPNETRGKELALAFLEAHDLLPNETNVDTESPQYYWNTQVEVNTTTDQRRELETNVQVRFERLLDGYPTTGAGAKLYVHFSDGHHLSGVTKVWPDLQEKTTENVRSIDTAIDLAEKGDSAVRMDTPAGCARLTVTAGHIEYYVPGPANEAELAFPVFTFQGTCTDVEGEPLSTREPARVIVPAVG